MKEAKGFSKQYDLFRETRTIDFEESQNGPKFFTGSFVLSSNTKKWYVGLSAIAKDDSHDFERFTLLFLPSRTASRPALYTTYEPDNVNPQSEKDFRNWPEELLFSFLDHPFLDTTKENYESFSRGMFVKIFETLDWNPEQIQKSANSHCINALLRVYEPVLASSSLEWVHETDSSTWVHRFRIPGSNDRYAIPTDVPVTKLSAFCLSAGRFPYGKELPSLRLAKVPSGRESR